MLLTRPFRFRGFCRRACAIAPLWKYKTCPVATATTSKGIDMSEKKATVHWEGRGKTGQGKITTETVQASADPHDRIRTVR